MISKLTEIDLIGAIKGLLIAMGAMAAFIWSRVNKRFDKNDDQTIKNTTDIQELKHDIKDILKCLDIMSKNLSKLDTYTHRRWHNFDKMVNGLEGEGGNPIWNTIVKMVNRLEAKIDDKNNL